MEVLGPDGNVTNGLDEVINRWERDFKVFSSDPSDFDERFYKEMCSRKKNREPNIKGGTLYK